MGECTYSDDRFAIYSSLSYHLLWPSASRTPPTLYAKIRPLMRIKVVEPLEKFNVRLTFEDGAQKDVNLEKYLRGEVFAPMRDDPLAFRSVQVVGSTIGWENGADIDPYVLYYDLKPAWEEEPEAVTA